MADREQVIKSLKWLIFNFPLQENPKDDGVRMCNAIHVYAENAVKLLEAQGPRLMTLEELDSSPHRYIVIQTRDMPNMLEWYESLLFSVNVNWTVDFITLEGKKQMEKKDYGKNWRCWTSIPTEKQREAVPWTNN